METRTSESPLTKVVLLFSLISMAFSGYGLYVSNLAIRKASDSSIYEALSRQPAIVANVLADYARKARENEDKKSNKLIKALSPAIYNSASKIGYPVGETKIVEFMDYRCAFCKASLNPITAALAKNGHASIVVRQLPILGDISTTMAKFALAAGEQGKFSRVHEALLSAKASDESGVLKILRDNDVDVEKAKTFIRSRECAKKLEQDTTFAKGLDIRATPTFIVGGHLVQGWNEPVVKGAIERM